MVLDLNVVRLHGRLLRLYFRYHGLRPAAVKLDDSTTVHCWIPAVPGQTTKAVPLSLWPHDSHSGSQSVRVTQKKRPLLLLHGFGASAIWQWANQVPAFTLWFDVYMPDLLFFGDSWSSSSERTERFQAQCMARLLDKLGVESFAVAGISYGGFVAYRLATMYPERVKQLILTDSGLLMNAAEYEAMLKRWQVDSPAQLLLPTDVAGVQRLMQLAYFRNVSPPSWILRCTLPVMFESCVEEKRQLLAELSHIVENDSETFEVPSMPVMLVWGRQDEVFPLAIAERMQRFFGGSTKLHVLEDACHMSNVECSKEYNAVVLRFLFSHLQGQTNVLA